MQSNKVLVAQDMHSCVHIYCGKLCCEVCELNVQQDHVHLLVKAPSKVTISKLMDTLDSKAALRLFSKLPN